MRYVLAALLVLGACANDNEAIRNAADDKFRYTHFTYEGESIAELHFINESEDRAVKWAGDVSDAMVYLEQIDKGKCYFNPTKRGQAQEVECE